MREKGIISPALREDERVFEASLRPQRLEDFTGQSRLKENLAIAIEAARRRGEAMDHVLLYGPPGLGKTTLATIIAHELDVAFDQTSGPILQKKLDLTGILSNIRPRQVFFIDEIHRLLPDVEEMLYAALEDFRVDILVGAGPGARTHSLPIPRFTAIGATTRQGLVSAPLRGRFGLVLSLNHYRRPSCARSSCARPGCSTSRSIPRAPRRSPAAAGARRASPTGCCGASATTPRSAPTAASRSEVRARPSTCSRWTASDSTRSTRRSC
jgi:Holliday junction resolvasome RuvABC ATP-dependent DNA helicase subunit